MGRKSNTKKKIRKLVDENKDHAKKKITRSKAKKEAKKELEKVQEVKQKTKKASIKLPKLNIPKKKLFGAALAIIMIAILLSVGHLIFQKAFRATPVAKLLPAQYLTGLVEFNTNFEHYQLTKAFELLKNNPDYSKEALTSSIEDQLSLNYQADIAPWLGRQVAVAALTDDVGQAHLLYFAEYKSKDLLADFLSKHATVLDDQSDYRLYQQSGTNYYFTVIDSYLVAGDGRDGIEFLNEQQDGADKLYYDDKYRRIDNNLPLNHLGFFYLDFDKVNDSFIQKIPLLSEQGVSMEKFGPLIKLLDAEGIVLVAMDDNFALQSFLSLDPAVVKNAKYLPLKSTYHAELAAFLDAETLAFWGGENLGNQIKRFVEIMSGGDHTLLSVFDHLLQNYTEKYFGKDINFNQDILPILDGEFAFAIEKYNDQDSYKVIFELDSPQSDSLKIQELLSAFANRGGIFQPKIVEHVLEDGTVGREIIAVPEEIAKSESNYSGQTIYYLKMGERDFGIHYTILNNMAVFATQKEGITSTIDIISGDKVSLKSSQLFETSIAPILRNSDEVSYFNFNAVLPILIEKEEMPKILTIIDAVSNGRNYFNDGIVTLNYLHIK